MRKSTVIIIITLRALASCSSQSASPEYTVPIRSGDSIQIGIPLDKDGNKIYDYLCKGQVEKKLGLNNIETGEAQTELRFWYGYPFSDIGQLVIINFHEGKWNALLYTLKYRYNLTYDSIIAIDSDMKTRSPKSGWSQFITALKNLEVFNLPDYRAIPGYSLNTDEGGVIVEVATPNSYRLHHYPTPEMRQQKFWQAKNMEQVLVMIENEFNFKRLAL